MLYFGLEPSTLIILTCQATNLCSGCFILLKTSYHLFISDLLENRCFTSDVLIDCYKRNIRYWLLIYCYCCLSLFLRSTRVFWFIMCPIKIGELCVLCEFLSSSRTLFAQTECFNNSTFSSRAVLSLPCLKKQGFGARHIFFMGWSHDTLYTSQCFLETSPCSFPSRQSFDALCLLLYSLETWPGCEAGIFICCAGINIRLFSWQSVLLLLCNRTPGTDSYRQRIFTAHSRVRQVWVFSDSWMEMLII